MSGLLRGMQRPCMAIISVAVVLASIAAFLGLYQTSARRQQVLVVTTTLHQGQRLSAANLGIAEVSASSNVATIPVSMASMLRNRRALSTIPAGSLLSFADLTDQPSVAVGSAIVGMALKSDQLPAGGVSAGDHVMVVQAASASDPSVTPGVLVADASVFSMQQPAANSPTSGVTLVSVSVPTAVATPVALAAAADELSLVILPATGGPS